MYKYQLRTAIEINKHIAKLVETNDIKPSDSVIRNGFRIVIKRLDREGFD